LRSTRLFVAALTVPLIAAVTAPLAGAEPALSGPATEYNVLTAPGFDVATAERAVRDSGGTVLRSNDAVGLITVSAPASGFATRVGASGAVFGVAKATSIGQVPRDNPVAKPGAEPAAESDAVEKEAHAQAHPVPAAAKPAPAGMDPLDGRLWGLTSVRSDIARTVQPGDKRVKVGVIDTGIDGTHPDIAPNFDYADSRNFTRDIPADETGAVVDGPCEYRGCVDPADHDDNGHGTHVAGTIAAAANGFGISGVAPDVTLVNVRAGQDSGFFFLEPVVDALTYAGDAGLDVVNMSFYVDPWLYNCGHNPADSPAQQAAQRTIVEALTRALNYAYRKGVTSVVALGNEHTDLGAPQPDTTSPDYPANSTYGRTVDNADCLSLPVEGPHTIGVAAFGPSGRKADFSNYGTEQISVAAPGGYFRDGFGTDRYRTNENMILSAYPRNVALADGTIDAAGNITDNGVALGVQKATATDGRVGYYQYLQGTSMATPHATGVAALIVSQYGKPGRGGFGMSPDAVQRVLEGTAAKIACPVPRTVDYLNEGRDASFTATCAGTPDFNGFYGHGVVDGYAAITQGRSFLG